MNKPVCVIAGVGPGNGAAFAQKFNQQGYATALLARHGQTITKLANELSNSRAYICDVTDVETVINTVDAIERELGPIEVLIYNAGSRDFHQFEETSLDEFELAWQVNTLGCFQCCQAVVPHMKKTGYGNIVIIGATASLRGSAGFVAFCSAKAAQRSLAESMARHLGPMKIHVSYLIIDALVDMPASRAMAPDKPDEFFIQPAHIADTVYSVVQQPHSCWTFELDVRPYRERW